MIWKRLHVLTDIYVMQDAGVYLVLGMLPSLLAICSIYILSRINLSIENHTTHWLILVWFIIQVASSLSSSISYYWGTRWKLNACRKYTLELYRRHFGLTSNYSSPEKRNETYALMSSVAPGIIVASIGFASSLLFNFLGSLSVFISVSVLLDHYIFFVFSASFLLSMLASRAMYSLSAKLSNLSAVGKKLHYANFSDFWDNIVLGNTVFQQFWKKRFEHRFNRYLKLSLARDRYLIFLEIIMYTASIIPAMGYLVFKTYSLDSPGRLLTTVLLIPSIYGALSSLNGIFFMFGQAGFVKGQMKILIDGIEEIKGTPLTDRINQKQIYIDGSPLERWPELLSTNFRDLKNQRYLIKGRNGSGKTSLLLYLKDIWGERAGYLPPNSSSLLVQCNRKMQSSGNLRVRQLESFFSAPGYEALLLDEWDTHMDIQNKEYVNGLIQQFVKDGGVVFEALHERTTNQSTPLS